MPLVSEATVIGDVAFDADWVVPPSLDTQVAVKPVIVLAPSLLAENDTTAELLPPVTPVMLGAAGGDTARIELEALEAALSPVALVATTVQVYVLPLVSEPTVMGEVALDADRVVPPSLDAHVVVKPVMALPPLPFAVNATTAEFVPAVTPVREGAIGTVPARIELEAADAELSPIAFVATTVQV